MSSVTLALVSGFVAAVLALALYHLLFVTPRLRGTRADPGARHPSATGVAGRVAGDFALDPLFAKRTDDRLDELERLAARDMYRVGFVRYNSFADVGSDLSFALALLNREGDGAVVSSIYSREETRTFGKSVRKFAPQHDASKEEQQAIAMARTGMGS